MEQHGRIRTRRLPHWDLPGATYFVTTCLAGSIPAKGLLEIAQLRAALVSRRSECAETPETERWKRVFSASDCWLDEHPAVQHLSKPDLATIVADACYFWVGHRYDLLAYVVMPSHLHWVFRPMEVVGQVANLPEERQLANLPRIRSPREKIMHTLKLHTAKECNRRLGRRGKFWQDESYDHCVRDDGELERIIHYVEHNPVKAGLTDKAERWPFSSARDRAATNVLLGQPLTKPVT
jgi:putative transposase